MYLDLVQNQFKDAIIENYVQEMYAGVAEGINRIVKIVKTRASGFRHLDAFADLIYLTVGDVDIPAQIPENFRAI